MSKINPTAQTRPSKPFPDFPLFPHATKRWAKKINGRLHYFGPWSDPDGALEKFKREERALREGRLPKPDTNEVRVKDLVNLFLEFKQSLVNTGELSPRTWTDYKEACDLIMIQIGARRPITDLDARDFARLRKHLGKTWGLVRVGKVIQYVRCVFKYGYDAELLDKPIRFGPEFKKPSKANLRKHRAKKGPKLFTQDEILKLLEIANPVLRAMILLACNAGFGNSDCAHLPMTAIDLDRGWIDFPRPKTGIPRRAPLWPETVQAIRDYLDIRPDAKHQEDEALVFLTKRRTSWSKDTAGPLSAETRKLLVKLDIHRPGCGFYTFRHVFRTVADETKDQVAIDLIMGHSDDSMANEYRERIQDDRLKQITDHVKSWLFVNKS